MILFTPKLIFIDWITVNVTLQHMPEAFLFVFVHCVFFFL